MQGFPTFKGLRGQQHGSLDAASAGRAAAAPASAQPAPPTAELPQPTPLTPEVADAEQLLEELDACGVSKSRRLQRSGERV